MRAKVAGRKSQTSRCAEQRGGAHVAGKRRQVQDMERGLVGGVDLPGGSHFGRTVNSRASIFSFERALAGFLAPTLAYSSKVIILDSMPGK